MIRILLKLNACLLVSLTVGLGIFLFVQGGIRLEQVSGSGIVSLVYLCLNTIAMVAVATLLAIGVSLPAALGIVGWLPSRSSVVRCMMTILDLGAALPSIVWGLFGLATVCRALGISVQAGIVTLAIMLIPMLSVGLIGALREVDTGLAESGAALGLKRGVVLARILLPTARPGILAAVSLAIGRGLADAAALMFTAGVAVRFSWSWLEYPGATLSVHVFDRINAGRLDGACVSAALLFGLSLLVQRWVVRFLSQKQHDENT